MRSREEMELELELELARARQHQEELQDFDWSTVSEGAASGAAMGASTLPAWAMLARQNGRTPPPPGYVGPGAGGPPSGPPPPGFRSTVAAGRKRGVRSALRSAVTELAESAAQNPKAFAAAEIAGAAGAGAAAGVAREAAQNKELGPTGTAVAETAAGLAGGAAGATIPVGTLNTVRSMGRWMSNDLAQILGAMPMTGWLMRQVPGLNLWPEHVAKTTAERRAATELQRLSGDPKAAAQAALDAPEGVSPARATGEPGLMGLETLIMKDDPAFGRMITESLETAVNRAQGALRDLYATPRGRQDWERAIVSHGAMPGTEIPLGSPRQMLNTAYESFGPAYEPFKQYPAKPRLFELTRNTPLNVMFRNLVNSRTTMAGEDTRRSVGRWLDGKMTALNRRQNKEGYITTGDLLDLRSDIRAKIREASDTTDGTDRAELLEMAESRVNQVLKSWLPPDSMPQLNAVDRQYGVLKTLMAAMRSSKDEQLTPDNVLAQLRYGGNRALRQDAQSGRPAQDFLGKGGADRARVVYEQMDEPSRANLRGDLVHTLADKATKDGVLDGATFGRLLTQNAAVARNMGMSHEEIGKLERVSQSLRMMQRPSPGASDRMLHDGPSDVMNLMASLIGAKVASEVTGATGSRAGALPVAGFMTRYYRKLLNAMTGDRAATLLIEASRPENKALYAALLTRNTDPPIKHKQAARLLNMWLYGQVLPDAADALGGAADAGLEELRSVTDELGE